MNLAIVDPSLSGARARTRVRRARVRRGHLRGAALVEAAVVIPVMLVFLGLIMFTYRSYAMKIDQQSSLRAAVLNYASHNCEGGSGEINDDSALAPSPGGSVIDRPASNLNMKEAGIGAFSPFVNKALAHKSAVVAGSAAQDRKLVTFSRPVTTTSTVACNQKAYQSGLWGLLDIAGQLATSGGSGLF